MIYGLWSFCCLLALTLWHGLKAIAAALVGIPDRQGGFYDRELRAWARHLLHATRLPVVATGLDRLDPGRAYVFAVNHASFVDIWVLLAYLPGSVRLLAKRSLFRVPLLGWALKATGQIAVDRRDRAAAIRAYEEAAGKLRGGRSMIVFVEGTRSRDGRLREFKKGGFVLAIIGGVPLVPVYLRGTYHAMPRGSLWLHRGPVGLVIGEPLPTDGLTYDDRGALLGRAREWFLAQQAAVDRVGGQG